MAKFYGLKGNRLTLAITLVAGMDFLLFGYDQGVMGGLLTLDSFRAQFPSIDPLRFNDVSQRAERNKTATRQGIAVGCYNLGCFSGAIATIWLGDWLGRRRTIFTGSAIMVVGAALQCSSFSLAQFIVGRMITGFGNGMNTSTVPMWQSETSSSHKRGQFVMIEGALIIAGVMISYWMDFGFSFVHHPMALDFRFPIAFQIFFALIILVFVLALPESPRWLILKNREEEALTVLSALQDRPVTDSTLQAEFTAIKDTVLLEKGSGFKDLFTMDENRNFHRVCLGYVNQVFQQISGINLITYYAATIYQTSIGLSPLVSRLLAAFNGTEYFLASWIAPFIIESAGRRKLMIWGAVGQSLCMVVLAITTSIPGNRGAGITAALFLFLFNTAFAIGWLGMTWLYPAEITPLSIRARANAVSTSANWLFNFMVVMITPVAFSSIQYRTYIIFAVINAFIVPVVYFFYPETAYRSLEEMDGIFRETKGVFNVVKVARDMPRRYGKHGELLIDYEQTEVAAEARRKSSTAGVSRGLNMEQVRRLSHGSSEVYEHRSDKV